MDIDPHKYFQPVHRTPNSKSKKRLKETSDATPNSVGNAGMVFNSSELQQVIQESLDAMPEVRRNLVEVGRELADDPNYPSAEELDELGRLALRQFAGEDDVIEEA